MSALRLEGLSKTFPGGAVAVDRIDLDVAPRELLVLLGPSGCGKSTLLRMIAGIESPSAGRILLAGQDVTALPPQRRDIAMVFQSYALYPHMTVRQNLAFGLEMRGLERSVINARVAEVAESLGLTPLLARRPSQLSGGQRQRVALGRAIARQAQIFLLDEPLSNLDVQLRVTTRMELARLHHRVEAPMIYVTHDQEEAMTLGDRIAVMRDGRIEQIGSPMDLYLRPATQFVAGFVGSPRMNFLPAESEVTQSLHAGKVLTGIRPEDISLVDAPAGDFVASIDLIEPLGREQLVHLSIPTEATSVDLRVLGPVSPLVRGQSVGVALRRERLHFFEPATGARVV